MRKLIQWKGAKYWTRAWNPMTGCKPCSPACENCWAQAMVRRFEPNLSSSDLTRANALANAFNPRPTKSRRPPRKGVVFCGNMTDLWGEWNYLHEGGGYYHKASDYIARTLDYDKDNPNKEKATYLWLTKRAKNMAETLDWGGWSLWNDDCTDFSECDMSNQWFGFTAENQKCYEARVGDFRGIAPGWANGWLSVEPLLGPVDLGLRYIAPEDQPFKWVVVGCESGPRRRMCKLEWIEDVVAECRGAGVPVFVKQIDLYGKCVADINLFPAHLRIRQVPWVGEEVEA